MTIKLNLSTSFPNEELVGKNPLHHENQEGEGIVAKIINFLGTNKLFLYLSFAHLFTLVHEFGHALAYKMISGTGSTIYMSPNNCFGVTKPETKHKTTVLQEVWISLSGHLATVLFSAIIILSVFALTHYVVMPLGLVIALRIIVAVPIILRILGEGAYAITSYKNVPPGDFGSIRQIGGSLAVFLSTALLISLITLCIIGIVFLF